MVRARWDVVWDRVRSGRHMAVIGASMVPPAPRDLAVLRVSCEGPGTSGGALTVACRQVEQLLGEEPVLPEPGREPFEPGLRHRFLGDLPWQPIDARQVTQEPMAQ